VPLEPHMPAVAVPPAVQAPPVARWPQKLSAILLIIFCLEVGCFLLVFPWIDDVWQNNFFSSLLHAGFWRNAYFRGAVSGLGVVNLYICFIEIFRLRKFW